MNLDKLDTEIERAAAQLEDVLRKPTPNRWKRLAERRFEYLRGLINARRLATGTPMFDDNRELWDRVALVQDWADTKGVK